jgi:hypothetical protein
MLLSLNLLERFAQLPVMLEEFIVVIEDILNKLVNAVGGDDRGERCPQGRDEQLNGRPVKLNSEDTVYTYKVNVFQISDICHLSLDQFEDDATGNSD